MTPEQENNLFQDIGEIREGIASLNKLLEQHTTQDMTQFTAMTDAVRALDVKVEKLVIDFAVTTAVDAEKEKNTKKIAGIRAAWVASIISVIGTLAQIFVPMLFK